MALVKESLIYERIALGLVDGVTPLTLIGVNGTTTTTHETLWDESTAYTFLAANMSSPTISSANANDTSAGTGARTITISGVDSNYAIQSETLSMNGQSGVALIKSYMSMNSMVVATAGSGGVNAGICYVGTGTVTAGKPAVVHGLIAAGLNQSTSFIYTVPAGYTLLINELDCVSRNTTAGGHEFYLRTITNLGLLAIPYLGGFLNSGGHFQKVFANPLVIVEKTQLQLTALSSAGTGPCYGMARCWLINNSSNFLGL